MNARFRLRTIKQNRRLLRESSVFHGLSSPLPLPEGHTLPAGNAGMLRSGNTSRGESSPPVAGRKLSFSQWMSRVGLLFAVLGLILSGTGCQCCGLTDCWCDHIDTFADHEGCCECLYCSELDPNRINRPGGPCACGDCRPAICPHPVFAHRWGPPRETTATDAMPVLETLEQTPPEDHSQPEPLYFPEVDPDLESGELPGPGDMTQRGPVRVDRDADAGPRFLTPSAGTPSLFFD
jgi:hypothetical protein